MPNMSYVVFENTYSDLYDCYQKMQELHFQPENLSTDEAEYYNKLLTLCRQINEEFEMVVKPQAV